VGALGAPGRAKQKAKVKNQKAKIRANLIQAHPLLLSSRSPRCLARTILGKGTQFAEAFIFDFCPWLFDFA
jgi:hypothetical protein